MNNTSRVFSLIRKAEDFQSQQDDLIQIKTVAELLSEGAEYASEYSAHAPIGMNNEIYLPVQGDSIQSAGKTLNNCPDALLAYQVDGEWTTKLVKCLQDEIGNKFTLRTV